MLIPAGFQLPGDSRRRGAFTLIELLTVISIILILAGLVLGLASRAQTKGAQSRAQAEIQALSAAATNYQIDNGTYPRITKAGATKNTDGLDARTSYDPTPLTPSPSYTDTSLILYQLLCGSYYIVTSGTATTLTYYNQSSPPAGITKPTTYYPFKGSQLKLTGGTVATSGYIDPSTVIALIDPFGFSYGYSTAYQADIDAGATPSHGYNPTFDLWSTSGYTPSGSSGKTYPSDITSTNYYTVWVKNW